MRDFSFRAYHPGERKTVYFDFNDIAHHGEVIAPDFDGRFCILSECAIMQATGLTDRDGRDIYEGDILAFDAHEWGSDTDNRFVVEWDAARAAFSGNGTPGDWHEWCVIVGNAHEHPDLLTATVCPAPPPKGK